MRSSRAARGFAPAAEPNVIPFIDVLLVLLIIFMVTAPKPTTDLRLDLPSANTIPTPIVATIVDLRRAAPGVAIAVGGETTEFGALRDVVLRHALAANAQFDVATAFALAPVYVRADQDIAYAEVVAVLDELQHARFRKVGVFAQEAD